MEQIGRYSTLIQNIVIILLLSCTCFITTHLLWLSRKLLFTPVFKIHLFFTTLLCIICIINSSYLVIFWRPDEALYFPLTLYITSMISAGMMQSNFIADIFLCLDRCFIIAFPKYYNNSAKLLLGILQVLGLTAILFYQFVVYGVFQHIPEAILNATSLTNCPHVQCLFNNSDSEIMFLKAKFRWGIINFVLAVVLILLIKVKIKMSDIKNKLHYAVALALVFTLIFEFVPNSIGVLVNLATGKATTAYAGPYWTTSSTINIFICNFMYSKAILKRNVVNSAIISHIYSLNKTNS